MTELAGQFVYIDAAEQIDEQADADRDACEDLQATQRPSCASTAARSGGTVVGRVADSSAVSGSLRP